MATKASKKRKKEGWIWVGTYKNITNAKKGLIKRSKDFTIFKGHQIYKRVGRRVFMKDTWK